MYKKTVKTVVVVDNPWEMAILWLSLFQSFCDLSPLMCNVIQNTIIVNGHILLPDQNILCKGKGNMWLYLPYQGHLLAIIIWSTL